MTKKTYSELMKFNTFEERFNYLKLEGIVGEDTPGHRYLRQVLYKTEKWRKETRPRIIARDNGCDLGVPGRELNSHIVIHHINPITEDDILNNNPIVHDPENLISVSHLTHNAIHYSNEDILMKDPIIRSKNDTCPWKK